MFGKARPVVIDYGHRRSGWRVPRWLVLLMLGIGLGVGGMWFVQERYLPPRLSQAESVQLRSAFERADGERQQLQSQLGDTSQRLQAALADKQRQDAELAAPRAAAQRLRDELAAVIATLPPDPRGGAVAVRSGRLAAQGGALAYDLVLTRERDAAKPTSGTLQLSVLGANARGAEISVDLKPVEVSIASHEIVRGKQALPEGFKPRQATIQVLERASGKPLGMRVLLVQ